MTLSDIANIKTGMYTKPEPEGSVFYLQVKNFNQAGELQIAEKAAFARTTLRRQLLQPGDVLFAAKGFNNFAAACNANWGPCVASSSFFIITLNPAVGMLPEFLQWYINNPRSLRQLKAEALGTAMPSISIKALGGITVAVPPASVQQKIVCAHRLLLRQTALLTEQARLRENLCNEQLFEKISSGDTRYGK